MGYYFLMCLIINIYILCWCNYWYTNSYAGEVVFNQLRSIGFLECMIYLLITFFFLNLRSFNGLTRSIIEKVVVFESNKVYLNLALIINCRIDNTSLARA